MRAMPGPIGVLFSQLSEVIHAPCFLAAAGSPQQAQQAQQAQQTAAGASLSELLLDLSVGSSAAPSGGVASAPGALGGLPSLKPIRYTWSYWFAEYDLGPYLAAVSRMLISVVFRTAATPASALGLPATRHLAAT
jgi:hypothetical protein